MATGNVLKGKRARKEETAAFLLPESENDVVAAVSRCLRTVGPQKRHPAAERSATGHSAFAFQMAGRQASFGSASHARIAVFISSDATRG